MQENYTGGLVGIINGLCDYKNSSSLLNQSGTDLTQEKGIEIIEWQ